MRQFCSRKFLVNPDTQDVHTSGSIFLFWGKNYLGEDFGTISISDCDEKISITSRKCGFNSRRNFLNIIKTMIDVLEEKHKSRTHRRGGHGFSVRRRIITPDREFEHLYFETFTIHPITKVKKVDKQICLHCDLETCSPEDFKVKQAILLNELHLFREFLERY